MERELQMKTKEIETMPINQELLALITPQGIELKHNKVQLGEYQHKLQYVSAYPSAVNVGWLLNLKDIPNTTVSLVVTPIENVQEYVDGVSKGLTTDKNIFNTTSNEALRTQAEFKIKSAEKIIKDITVDNIPYVNVSFVSNTIGETDNNFNENCRTVRNKIAGMGLKARVPAFIQDKALRQSSPYDTYYDDITKISNKTMSLEALFLGLPFSGSGLVDVEGYYLGTDEDGRMIAFSPFFKGNDRTNSNIVIEGSSGSGKSFLAKKIMLNEWLNGTKIFVIDPESEMRPMCKLLGGKWIDCSGGTGKNVGRINPLQVNPLPEATAFEDDEDGEYTSSKSALGLHLDFLSTFFKLYYPEITSLQMSLLMEILEELYRTYGITYETDITNKDSKDFPIMEDLYNLLIGKVNTNKDHKKELEEIRAVVRELSIGHHGEIFNGYTSLDLDSSFVCLDVYSLQGASEKVKRCQYFNILRYCQDQAFRNREERCYVVCDEAYLLVDRKVPQTIEFLRNFCKRARKYECGLMVITQSLVDFLAPEVRMYGQAFLDNSTYKFFFGVDGKDLEEVVNLYNLNQEEKAILSQKDKRTWIILYWFRTYINKCKSTRLGKGIFSWWRKINVR